MTEISNEAVWAVCQYRGGGGVARCKCCPESFEDAVYGKSYNGCYLLTRETIEKSLRAVAEHPETTDEQCRPTK